MERDENENRIPETITRMRASALLLLSVAAAQAQPGELRCDIRPIQPKLNFSLRFQTGYVVKVPLSQFSGAGHGYRMRITVTPEGSRHATVLDAEFNLPPVPQTNMDGESSHSFLVGEGKYGASLTVEDDLNRTCGRDWSFEAKHKAGQRETKLTMPPGAVAALDDYPVPEPEPGAASTQHLTVLLHAAGVSPKSTAVSPEEIELLLGALSSLMHEAGAPELRLIVFNLDQQRAIYQAGRFRLADLPKVSQAISELQLATMDYHAVQAASSVDLLTQLLTTEVQAAAGNPVVILGPKGRVNVPYTRHALTPSPHSRVYYVQYVPEPPGIFRIRGVDTGSPGGMSADSDHPGRGVGLQPVAALGPRPFYDRPDLVQQAVEQAKGKTFVVTSAEDFIHAVEHITHAKR